MKQKYCSACDKVLSIDSFTKTKNGVISRCKNCFPSIKKEESQKARKRNSDFIKDYKSEKGCCFCGENDSVALDAHHKDPRNKAFELSKAGYRSIKNIKQELAKCIILCANCHRKFHAGRFLVNEDGLPSKLIER